MTARPALRQSRILQATALGDSVGAGYEFADPAITRVFRLADGFRQHGLYAEIGPGMFTDDALMSYGVGRAMVAACRRQPVEHASDRPLIAKSALAQSFLEVHRAHPGKGYSKHVETALNTAADDIAFLDYFETTHRSDSNGAVMRSAAYGVFADLGIALDCARTGATITHAGWGVSGAVAVAAASHYAFHRIGPRADLNRWLARHVDPVWTTRYREMIEQRNGPLGLITTLAALTVVRESRTLTEVLERAIRVGGDVDSVAAVSLAIAVSFDEITDDLPAELWAAVRPVSGLGMPEMARLDAQLSDVAAMTAA